VLKYVAAYDWIELIRMTDRKDRNFSAKAVCFNSAHERLRKLSYALIGNVDADVSFGPDYFEFLLGKFLENSHIGVAGTRYVENGEEAVYSSSDVAGQCQIFRRECLEELGGYFPSKYGGVDWIAVRTARMNGWKTITFSERVFYHHRTMSSAETNKWVARIRMGRKDYVLGNHPVWQCFRIIYQSMQRPYIIGGLLLMCGYLQGLLTQTESPVPRKLVAFHRKEQMRRLKSIVRKGFKKGLSEEVT
jgi:biofilm PGA synthesis N-glycosyltransferase PgaC